MICLINPLYREIWFALTKKAVMNNLKHMLFLCVQDQL